MIKVEAQYKNGDWIVLTTKKDGYYNGHVRIANKNFQILHSDYKKLTTVPIKIN